RSAKPSMRVRIPPATPHDVPARKADLVKAPRRNRGEVGSKPTPSASLRALRALRLGEPAHAPPPPRPPVRRSPGGGGSPQGEGGRSECKSNWDTHKGADMLCKQVAGGALPRCSTSLRVLPALRLGEPAHARRLPRRLVRRSLGEGGSPQGEGGPPII